MYQSSLEGNPESLPAVLYRKLFLNVKKITFRKIGKMF